MSNTYSQLYYHLVWSTKDRTNTILKEFQDRLYGYLAKVVKNEGGRILAIGGIADHIHLLVNLPARVHLPALVRQMKAGSSQWVFKERLLPFRFCWQEGYGAFSVSRSGIDAVAQYIENQEMHHKTCTFEDEYVALLTKHGVLFDKRYVLG